MRNWKGQIKRSETQSVLCFDVLLCAFLFVLFCTGCAATSARDRLESRQAQSNARAAAYAAEGFMPDHRSPEARPFRSWEFYYKHCALVSRNPYPDRAEYSCSDPH